MKKHKYRILLILVMFSVFLLFSSCAQTKDVPSGAETSPSSSLSLSLSLSRSQILPLQTDSSDNAVISPSPSPTPIPKAVATLLSAGDVIMHDAVILSGKKEESTFDYTSIFKEIRPYVKAADFSIISYEGVTMDSDNNYTGYPLFNAPPAIMTAFSDIGFKMVNTGNNHSLDRGIKGLIETYNIIRQQKMQVIGTFLDNAAPRHRIHDLNGIRVGFLSYTYGCNMNENKLTPEERETYISLIDEEKIRLEMDELSKGADLLVVLMHWGTEYRQEPTESQKNLADNLLHWGADVILGSHPHVVEPSEVREIDGEYKYIIYSMGNFLSNQIGGHNPNPRNNELTEDGMMVSLQIEKDYETGKTSLVSVTHIPTWVYRYTENGVYQYTIYPIPSLNHESLDGLNSSLAEKLRASYNRTMSQVKDWSLDSSVPAD